MPSLTASAAAQHKPKATLADRVTHRPPLSRLKLCVHLLLPVTLLALYLQLALHRQSLGDYIAQLGLLGTPTNANANATTDHHGPTTTSPLLAPLLQSRLFATSFAWPQAQTLLLAAVLYVLFGFCHTAGYHRLWAHQSFTASLPLKLLFALGGAANFSGSIVNWARNHRAHHRHIDTPQDPFSIHNGLLYTTFTSHLSCIERIGSADISDLKADGVVQFQKHAYLPLAVGFGWILPAAIASQWGDAINGFFIAGVLRALLFTHIYNTAQALCRQFGTQPYSQRCSARNNTLITALTLGEGFLNFHYEFPRDYRMGARLFHLDATKWAVKLLGLVGLASDLHTTPLRDALLLRIQTKQEKLDAVKKTLAYGPEEAELPVMTTGELRERVAEGRLLVTMDRLVLDLTTFVANHPGGEEIIRAKLGKDITIAFNGGVQRHSKAARNLAALMRVARLAQDEPATE